MSVFIIIVVMFNILIFKYNIKIANFLGLYDKPDNLRKIHKSNIPLTGGVIILLNIFILFLFIFYENFYHTVEIFLNDQDLLIFVSSILLFFFIGFIDDKFEISANRKFLMMIFFLIPVVIYSQDLMISEIRVSFLEVKYFLPNFVAVFWTILCFLLFVNALNMFDGINYQVCIFSLYICTFFLINNYFTILFIIVIISLFNFLILNHGNKAFLGDNGTYLLSFLFSYFFIKMYNQDQEIYTDHIFLIMIIPGIDLIRLFLVRISKGNYPFTPDRNHLHHILLRKNNLVNVNLIIQSLIIFPSIGGFYFGYTYFFLLFQLLTYFYLILIYKKK
tara:strand:- start:989 stop:1987 length:999 start_codon:yes stop_codon:yes gene_type:complete